MKKLYIKFSDCGSDGFEFLENASCDIDIAKDGMEFWMCDAATGARILCPNDVLGVSMTEEQETAIRLRFGEKITESI